VSLGAQIPECPGCMPRSFHLSRSPRHLEHAYLSFGHGDCGRSGVIPRSNNEKPQQVWHRALRVSYSTENGLARVDRHTHCRCGDYPLDHNPSIRNKHPLKNFDAQQTARVRVGEYGETLSSLLCGHTHREPISLCNHPHDVICKPLCRRCGEPGLSKARDLLSLLILPTIVVHQNTPFRS